MSWLDYPLPFRHSTVLHLPVMSGPNNIPHPYHPLLPFATSTSAARPLPPNSTMRKTSISVRLALSYVLDWIVILAFAAAGAGLNSVNPNHRAFSLLDLDISYPYVPESISITTAGLVSLLGPAAIILVIVLVAVPGPSVSRASTRAQVIRLKLWELQAGWGGLALSVATAFFITQGTKQMFGKPRPNLIARCQPDLSDIASHVVGGFGQDISARWTLVTYSICTQSDASLLADGFRSFPSGHSSFSWAGLLYLTLFVASKFSIAIPFLPFQASVQQPIKSRTNDHELLPIHHGRDPTEDSAKHSYDAENANAAHTRNANDPINIRNTAATPPNHLIILALIPIGVAIYISATRYSEYYHHGFDVISGSLLGIVTAVLSFRWYHLPLSRGQGWAWGARSRERAFGIGVGTNGYVGSEGWESGRSH